MSIKTILVHLVDDDQFDKRLELAINLGSQHGAHLTGLFFSGEIDMPGGAVGRGLSRRFLEATAEEMEKEAVDLATRFKDACSTAELSHAFYVEEGDYHQIFEQHARAADLIIVSQTQPHTLEDYVRHLLAEELVLESGVPVLMVPREAPLPNTVGRTILVSYTSTRESVRAVKDALPFLQLADKVILLTQGTPEETGHLPLSQVQDYLRRHGIASEIDRHMGDTRDFGPAILARAKDHGADLIIMGASGRARLREIFSGSAAGHVFRNLDIPVIASH